MKVVILARTTALVTGFSAAAVGAFATYEAAPAGYLKVAAPIVAFSAALLPVFAEHAAHHRQWFRAAALLACFVPAAATVFFTAAERVHLAKAEGEAERSAIRLLVDRTTGDLTEAKAAAKVATAAADKVRGKLNCKTQCLSLKASETAALSRVADAEAALKTAQAKAVTESDLKAPSWLLPAALDVAGIVLLSCGFGLGRLPAAPVEEKLTKRQIAARKGAATRRKRANLRKTTVKNGKANLKVAA